MADQLAPHHGRDHATVTSYVVQLVVLAAFDVVVRLALHVQAHAALLDNASEFFLAALVVYWVYCLGVDLFKHFFAAGSEEEEEESPLARTGMFTTVAITACAAIVLTLAAFVAARLRSAGVGGHSLPVMVVVLGVIDARVVADAVEHLVRTRHPRTRPL